KCHGQCSLPSKAKDGKSQPSKRCHPECSEASAERSRRPPARRRSLALSKCISTTSPTRSLRALCWFDTVDWLRRDAGATLMIPSRRQAFNSKYRAEKYPELLSLLAERCGVPIGFRVSETPCFLPPELLARTFLDVYGLDQGLRYLLSGLDSASYLALLRRAIVGSQDPENVILMEIDPLHQKTLPDFLLTEKLLGIKTVDIRAIKKEGNRL